MKGHTKRLITGLVLAATLLFSAAFAAETAVITTNVDALMVGVGKIADYQLSVAPKEARRAGYTFATTDEGVATADRRGRVKGIAAGACDLVITSNYDPSVSKTIPITVVTLVRKLTAQAETVNVGEQTKIGVAYAPQDATVKEAVYTSKNEKVATVDENGVVTGVSRGQTTIMIASKDGGAKTALRISVRQQPESIKLSAASQTLVVGRRLNVKADVLPKNTDNKKLIWSSSDESVATVNQRGQVTAVAPGAVVITAACEENPAIASYIRLSDVLLAKTIAFGQRTYGVTLGQSQKLDITVAPENTTDKSVSYQSSHPAIVSVDKDGVVTALKAGKATITAATQDGSRRRARTTVEVIVPVTGVHFTHPDVRVGAGYHATFTAVLEPKEASNHAMSWSSEDTDIAVVSSDTNRVRISGRRWGRCEITGVTEDGGYSCSVFVNVGSLRRAVTVRSIEIRNGAPHIVLRNDSDMHILSVSFKLTGTDEHNTPIVMSSQAGETLYGEYNLPLEPGEETRHGYFDLYHHTDYPNMQSLSIAITGWTTDTGYYGHDDALYYDYTVPEDQQDWQSYETELFTQMP